MKYKLTLTVFMLMALMAFTPVFAKEPSSKIDFNAHKDFSSVLTLANQEHKIVFFDGYTKWCAPCRKMDVTTYLDDGVVDFLNENFISYHMDMDHKNAKLLAERYNILTYPALIFMDHKGNVILKHHGYMPPQKFLAFAQHALNANGQREAIPPQPDIDQLYAHYFKSPTGKNYKKIKMKLAEAMHLNDVEAIEKIHAIAKTQDASGRIEHKLQMDTAILNQNWGRYERLALAYFQTYQNVSAMDYKKSSYVFYGHVSTPSSLIKAVKWMSNIPQKGLSKGDLKLVENLKIKSARLHTAN